VGEPLRRDLPGGGENSKRDRKVVARPLLAKPRGREVDRDPPHRPLELGGGYPGPDPFLRLLAGAVGEPDDGEARNARLEVRLDLDLARLEPDECMGDRACKHGSTVPGRRSRVVTAFPEIELQECYGV
jgi:hypothetical protein